MDSFWNEIKGFNFDLKGSFKVKNYLENLEKKLQKRKQKK